MRRVVVIALVAATALFGQAAAQSVHRIAAIVNDQVVSAFDVQQRIALVILSTGLQNDRKTQRRLQPQVLRTLIDERIQMQEAQRLNIEVNQGDIDRATERIENQNNIPPGGLTNMLRRSGVTRDAFVEQVTSAIAWSKLVQGRLRPTVTVSDEEVQQVVDRIEASVGETEFRVAEIFLSVGSPDDDEEARRTALRLIEQIRSGARFSAIAREFSQGVTAGVGGDMGWVQPEQLPQEIADALQQMDAGRISAPVRSTGGYYILLLRQKREVGGTSVDGVRVKLKQILLPTDADDDVAALLGQAAKLRERLGNCAEVEKMVETLGSQESGDLGEVKLTDLPENIRAAVAPLQPDQVSAPVQTAIGVHLFAVCGRSGDQPQTSKAEGVRSDIGNRRLSMLARRYLRDLRRDAVVEFP
jgi:peptidyl-prolyl cis-trans isomerase SurA